MELNHLYNMDCVEGMQQYPDKYFELAIVDPPYFSGPEKQGYYGQKISPIGVHRSYQVSDKWVLPDPEYFTELERVSKNQIVWGCNYFIWEFPPGRIVWDKCNGSSSFSDCEIASCSLNDSVRIFRYMWNGMLQGKSISQGWVMQGNKRLNEIRIHPTQKPVALYEWLLGKYAKPGDKILDTHAGSASSLVACENMGFDYVGFELDTYYWQLATERLEAVRAQTRLC